jgi:hypothetical protein
MSADSLYHSIFELTESDGPLRLPREIAVNQYAGYLRQAAERFRTGVDGWALFRLIETCGVWMVQLADAGLLPDSDELRELVRWHTGDAAHDPVAGRDAAAVRKRCPYNLFLDFCGGGSVRGRIVGDKVVPTSGPIGGLLPRFVPGCLQLSPLQRHAEACAMLADWVARPSAPDHRQGGVGKGADENGTLEFGPGLTTPREMAARYSVSYDPLRARLGRWRRDNPDQVGRGWVENKERGSRDAKYLYAPVAVRAIIEALTVFSGAPSEKKSVK